MESAFLYRMDGVLCPVCLSFPLPPVYHCFMGHFLCSKCHKNSSNQCTIEDCEEDLHLCKLSTFLLTRMEIICPNKSHGCPISLPIKDFTTHVKECPVSHPQYNSSCPCPCCRDEFENVKILMSHFESEHEPIEVNIEKYITLMMVQEQKQILKLKSSEKYLLLKFKEEAVSLHHMWWDEPRCHDLHVKDSDHDWSFLGLQTLDTRSNIVEQYLELPLIFPEVTVELRIGEPNGKAAAAMALLNLADLADHASLPHDADVKMLVCLLCERIAPNSVIHCTYGHTMCLNCYKLKCKQDRKQGKFVEQIKCPYCSNMVMRCNPSSYILKKSEGHCPNKSVGCQKVVSVSEYEAHLDECLKPFCCPICGTGFDDFVYLVNHFADHRPTRVKYRELSVFMVCRGPNLIKESSTKDNFLLMFEENCLCLQHMSWAEPQEYVIEFDDLDSTWSFHGKTVAMERFPRLSAECLKIPKSVLHPQSSLSTLISLTIMHDIVRSK